MHVQPHEEEVPQGFWPRVRARLRPLSVTEMPSNAVVHDGRMVDFFAREGSGVWLDGIDFEPYAPLRDPRLLGDFMHLFGREQAPADSEIVEFYARYGPLRDWTEGDGAKVPSWALRLRPEDRRHLRGEARLLLCEPVWWLCERARELRLTYDLYIALRERRTPLLRSVVGEVPKGRYIKELRIADGRITGDLIDRPDLNHRRHQTSSIPRSRRSLETSRRAWRTQMDEACMGLCTGLLARQLNAAEARSTRRWVGGRHAIVDLEKDTPLGTRPRGSLDLTRVRTVDNLVSAMYLHLGELVGRDMILRQCPGCGRLFYPRRPNQKHCDARCGAAKRQRLYYGQPTKALQRESARRRSRNR